MPNDAGERLNLRPVLTRRLRVISAIVNDDQPATVQAKRIIRQELWCARKHVLRSSLVASRNR
jgi:hypothetical protein